MANKKMNHEHIVLFRFIPLPIKEKKTPFFFLCVIGDNAEEDPVLVYFSFSKKSAIRLLKKFDFEAEELSKKIALVNSFDDIPERSDRPDQVLEGPVAAYVYFLEMLSDEKKISSPPYIFSVSDSDLSN